MRVSICVERSGKTYRLAWVSESRSGIYYGHLGSDRDHHLSYHQDGIRHFKSGDSRYHESVDVPLVLNTGFRQLSNANVPLSAEWLNTRTEYPSSRRDEANVSLREELLAGCDSLLIDYYLVDRASADEFRSTVSAPRVTLSLIDLRTFALDHSPGHLVGLAVWAGQTRY